MNEFIEKLIGRLEEYIENAKAEGDYTFIEPFEIAKNAVNKLAEEYKDKEVLDMAQVSADYAKARLEELKRISNNGWIPCSERLPEGNLIDCLVTLKNGVVTKSVYSEMHTEKFYMVSTLGTDYFYKENPVIAWQPLPDPYIPKQEEQKG